MVPRSSLAVSPRLAFHTAQQHRPLSAVLQQADAKPLLAAVLRQQAGSAAAGCGREHVQADAACPTCGNALADRPVSGCSSSRGSRKSRPSTAKAQQRQWHGQQQQQQQQQQGWAGEAAGKQPMAAGATESVQGYLQQLQLYSHGWSEPPATAAPAKTQQQACHGTSSGSGTSAPAPRHQATVCGSTASQQIVITAGRPSRPASAAPALTPPLAAHYTTPAPGAASPSSTTPRSPSSSTTRQRPQSASLPPSATRLQPSALATLRSQVRSSLTIMPDFKLQHRPLATGDVHLQESLGAQLQPGPCIARVEPTRPTSLRLSDSYVAWQDTSRHDPASPGRWDKARTPRAARGVPSTCAELLRDDT
jgi:hypothetical protein